MQIDAKSLLGGTLSWDRISRKAFAEESGVDPTVLSKVKAGEMGFSAKTAKQAAGASGQSGPAIFAASHAQSIAKRQAAGELDDGQVLGAVGRTYTVLKSDFGQEQVDLERDELFVNALTVLQGLAEQATKGAAPKSTMEARARDGSGIKTAKKYGGGRVQDDEPTATKSRANGTLGKLGRDTSGFKVEKRYGS